MPSLLQIAQELTLCLASDVTPLLLGERGIGKSSIVRELAFDTAPEFAKLRQELWGDGEPVGFINLRGSLHEAADFTGLPYIVGLNGNGNGNGNAHAGGNGHAHIQVKTGFDSASISEVTWSQWRACVVRHGLEAETLGRFAPSLRDITRVIWNTPLGNYTHCTLAEMRSMKTHGEKRIRAILEVFHCVNEMVGKMGSMPHLAVRIVPRQIDRVEQWVAHVRQTADIPSEQELFDCFVEPLLEQVRADAPQQIVALAENRLGLSGPITSVRQAARGLGLTRARIYQLLNEINDIMTVRWPNGRHQVYELREKLEAETLSNTPDLERFLAACELFYPASRRGADGAIEPAEHSDTLSPALTTRRPR